MDKLKKVRTWSTEETFRFIKMYQTESIIWNPKDKQHKDKNKVNDSWQRIGDGLGIPIDELKKKKETLMTAFRNQLKRKKASMRSGTGEKEIYKPMWMYYDAMETFLADIYEWKSVLHSEEDTQDSFKVIPSVVPEIIKTSENATTQMFTCSTITSDSCRKRPRQDDVVLESKGTKKFEDEFDAIGTTIAYKLRRMAEDQRNIAEHLCNDILYYGLGNKLTDSSFVCCTPSHVQNENMLPDYSDVDLKPTLLENHDIV